MSTSNEDDILQGIDYAARDNQRYEDGIVSHLLNRYGLGSEVRYRLKRNGDGWLTLDAFHEAFPEFPVTLAAKRWRKMREQNRVADLFGDFPERNFVKAWLDAQSQMAGGVDGQFGLVFHWPFLRGQRLAVRDGKSRREPHGGLGLIVWDGDPDWGIPGVRMIASSPDGGRLTISSFSVFLTELDVRYGSGDWQ